MNLRWNKKLENEIFTMICEVMIELVELVDNQLIIHSITQTTKIYIDSAHKILKDYFGIIKFAARSIP